MTHYKTLLIGLAAGVLMSACSNGHKHQQVSGHHGASYGPASSYTSQTYHSPGLQAHVYGSPQANGHYGYGQTHYGGSQGQYAQHPQMQRSYPQGYRNSRPQSRGAPYSGSRMSYESLNALEEPVATEIGGVTFELRGRVDSVSSYSFENKGNPDHRFVGSHRLTAEKQLPNRYTVGAIFTGRAEDIGHSGSDEYTGRIRGYVGGSWGTLWGGNVQDVVYEDTRRLRGAGRFVGVSPRETVLTGDGALGRLSDWGGGYQGRFGPTVVSTFIDEDANYDVGVKFQRPIGNKDYRLSARHNTGTFTAADGLTEIDTKAVTGVAEYVYGSTRYDVSAGYEQMEVGADDADRWFTSAGVTTKSGVWAFTAEGLYGETDGQDEISAFAGVKYDIARGLSATAGVDYQDRQVNVGGVNVVDLEDTRALMGLSYGF